ncbi:hypothetical protein GGR52DRAFT_573552 [Hypoxylon sp. FL1284]|nr:hypothetical protein GGR52DRAFT_573552 [Hypoxylon sp. FL1284]
MAPLLPAIAAHARSLLSTARGAAGEIAARTASDMPSSTAEALSQLGPLAARSILLARDNEEDDKKDDDRQNKVDPSKGVVKPQDINNTFMFVLFGLIGAALVCAGIWFFFWARNGGFHFRENDWEEYKSTVLRRKGPNGTLLSGATPSTRLGGGSVYKDVDDGATEYTGGLTQMTGDTGDTGSTLTGITAGASDLAGREKRRQKRERKEREREKKKDRKNRERSGKRRVGEDGVLVDEEAEAEARGHLRAYRHEKAARVGGLNKESEGSQWDGSTNPDSSTTAGSDLLSNRQSTPTSTPTKNEAKTTAGRSGGGIRKVYSTADRNANRENERMRREARREERALMAGSSGAGAGVKRDYSFQRARAHHHPAASAVSSSSSAVRESTIEEESDVGTKSYHHVIPGLSPSTLSGGGGESSAGGSNLEGSGVSVTDYADEKRRKRGSRYRRPEE